MGPLCDLRHDILLFYRTGLPKLGFTEESLQSFLLFKGMVKPEVRHFSSAFKFKNKMHPLPILFKLSLSAKDAAFTFDYFCHDLFFIYRKDKLLLYHQLLLLM